MFFRKSKIKKDNFQNSNIFQHEDTKSIGVPSDDIKPESKISNVSENLHIIGTVFSSGKISFNGSIKGTLESKSLYVGENGFAIVTFSAVSSPIILPNIKICMIKKVKVT